MAIISRPVKEGNATTYQGKVAAGYTLILASEVDADLDTIYAAWNGGANTANIADGAVTAAKLGPGAAAANMSPAGGDLAGNYPAPAVAKITAGTLPWNPRGQINAAPGVFDVVANATSAIGYDASKPAWLLRLDYINDWFGVYRAPAGGGSYALLCAVNNAGKFTGGPGVGARQTVDAGAFSTSTYNTPVLVWTLPAITTKGGAVLLTMNHSLYYSSSAVSGTVPVAVSIYRNGVVLAGGAHGQNFGCGGAQLIAPVPPLILIDTPPAGTYTYDLRVQVNSGTSAAIVSTGIGRCTAQELG